MGRKVHPIGFRLKINRTWDGRWFAEGENYVNQLHEDIAIRKLINESSPRAGIARIEIERYPGNTKVFVNTAKPGVLIGRKGENVKVVRKNLEALVGSKIDLQIKEIKDPDTDAILVARNIAEQLQRRISYRRAMSRALQSALRAGAKGMKVQVSGRLGGADMARTFTLREGRVPLHTLRADIDFAIATAVTTYSAIGIKVWIYKGEILPKSEQSTLEDSDGVYVSK
jgi:small subunit ribosomal protein S3